MNKLILAAALSLTGLMALPAAAQSGVLGLRAGEETNSERRVRESDAESAMDRRETWERHFEREGRRDGRRDGEDRRDAVVRPAAGAVVHADVQLGGRNSIGEPAHRDGRHDDRRDDRRYDQRDDHHYDQNDDRRWDSHRDDRYGQHDRWDDRYGHHDRWDDRHDYDRRHDRDHRRADRRYWAQHRYRAPIRYVYPRGYSHWDWRVGYRLPPAYYSQLYYIEYHRYGLPPPPRGYRWVRVNEDVLLVAITSGLIRDIVYGLFY